VYIAIAAYGRVEIVFIFTEVVSKSKQPNYYKNTDRVKRHEKPMVDIFGRFETRHSFF